MFRRSLWWNLPCLGALLAMGQSALASPSDADIKLLAKVAARVYAETKPNAEAIEGFPEAFAYTRSGPGWAWPPLVAISSDEDVNATARTVFVNPGEKPELDDEPNMVWIDVPGFESKLLVGAPDQAAAKLPAQLDGQPEGTIIQPVIVFKQGYLDVIVQGQEGPLAGCFGHEIAHVLLGHTTNDLYGSDLVVNAATRMQEADADCVGTAIAIRAKFDYDSIVAGARREREDGYHCSFLGLRSSHPGWDDRLALIDTRQRELWRSIDAFENGVYFLMTEQYLLAEKCFGEVIKKEPKCYEAWANKGYAELMQFCDALEPDDLRQFDIGQLVVGGFYTRPGSLGIRGIDEDMWFKAMGDLRQALLLKPDLVMAKANLAIAWLVRPAGKDTGKAEQLFQEVNDALKKGHFDEDIDPLVKATLLVNAGVAEHANGDPESAEALFSQARELIASTKAAEGSTDLANAIRFSRARMMVSRNEPASRKSAIEELEAYLANGSPAATWWTLALEQYQKLCKEQGIEPKPKEVLAAKSNTQFRAVSGVTLPNGVEIILNESVRTLDEALGQGLRKTLIEHTIVHRRRYADNGLDLLCTDKIVAIRLQGSKAPPLVLKVAGQSQQSHELRPGTSVADLDSMLAGDANQWDLRYGVSSAIIYRFYSRLGFGVRVSDDGKVMEIIVAQIPHTAVVE